MSYLALARKYRPRNFEEVVGQDHVVRTLSHALDNQRLHHAYLFTGTRGVGKTSIARILAKALSCEQGISSKPCNQCKICEQIDRGSFIDLIEVDAASRTKVEDTRALLDNVPFKSTVGRFKIYIIDEIHMLSGHSFNAFLKTLEEPPEHVKFLMATTDPQKLPVTVLSRCIQFNLRAMEASEISNKLKTILGAENVEFEQSALNSIARLSYGSMRDALSITDQAISYTRGDLKESSVRDMLGMVSQDYLSTILASVASQDSKELLKTVSSLFERSIDCEMVLDDLLLKLHDIGLHKVAPEMIEARADNIHELRGLSDAISAEAVQLYYQIGLLGKRDLHLAPNTRVGLEMVLLRMLAFYPTFEHSGKLESKPKLQNNQNCQTNTVVPATIATTNESADTYNQTDKPIQSYSNVLKIETSSEWEAFVLNSNQLSGPVALFARELTFDSRSGNTIHLIAPTDASPALMRKENPNNLEKILSEQFNEKINVQIRHGTTQEESIEKRQNREQEEHKTAVVDQLEREEIPVLLKQEFGATLDLNSIKLPSDNGSNHKPN